MGFHSLEGTSFTVTASFDGWTRKTTLPTHDQFQSSYIIPPAMVNPEMNYTILTEGEIQNLRDTELEGWQMVDGKLHKTFEFERFSEAFQFMYRVGLEAEKMNHHPDWNNSYGTVSVYLYTWSVDDKITDYDIRLAGVMDREAAALA